MDEKQSEGPTIKLIEGDTTHACSIHERASTSYLRRFGKQDVDGRTNPAVTPEM